MPCTSTTSIDSFASQRSFVLSSFRAQGRRLYVVAPFVSPPVGPCVVGYLFSGKRTVSSHPGEDLLIRLSHHLHRSTLPSLQSQGRRHSSTEEWKTRSKCFPSKGGKRTDPTPTMGNEREARSNAFRSLHDIRAHEMGWDGRNKAIKHVWPTYASCAIDPNLPNRWASAFMAMETLGKG